MIKYWNFRRGFQTVKVLVVDIGGGSTELISSGILNRTIGIPYLVSLDIGSIVCHEKYVHSDPINKIDFDALKKGVEDKLRSAPNFSKRSDTILVATAGTATTLAAIKLGLKKYSHSEVHGSKLKEKELNLIIKLLKSKTIEERKNIAGLEPKRADIILAGAVILLSAMQKYGFYEVSISDRGLRWGLIYENA